MKTCCVFDYANEVETQGGKKDKHGKKNKASDDEEFGKHKKFDEDFFGKKSACIFVL